MEVLKGKDVRLFPSNTTGLIFARGSSDSSSSSSSQGRPLTSEEKNLHKEAGGGKTDYDKITVVERAPTTEEVREAGKSTGSTILDKHSDSDISNITSQKDAISLPNDTIYTTAPSNKPLTAHEIEHQSQYQNGDKKDVFERLVGESLDGTSGKSDPYNTSGTLEYEAQQVQINAISIQQKGGI
ncbi:MAG: hypothetical protein SO369_07220 [Treponema sp.]|nr:hypothetical protein [Treponema sp.]